jgi:hypothetical protein
VSWLRGAVFGSAAASRQRPGADGGRGWGPGKRPGEVWASGCGGWAVEDEV